MDTPVGTSSCAWELTSRITIEQAKGVIAERERLDMPASFERLRASARSRNRRLHDVASDLTDGTLDISPDDLADD